MQTYDSKDPRPIFMKNISYTVEKYELSRNFRSIFHAPPFSEVDSRGEYPSPLNFAVFLFPDKRSRTYRHSGSGILTLPTELLTRMALDYFRSHPLLIDGRTISFERSNKDALPDVLAEIRLMPYRDPEVVALSKDRLQELKQRVYLLDVQFVWQCRDWVLSPEWHCQQTDPSSSDWEYDDSFVDYNYILEFIEETREVVVVRTDSECFEESIRMRYSHIASIDVDYGCNGLVFHLTSPPSFEFVSFHSFFAYGGSGGEPKRTKMRGLDENHKSLIRFIWPTLRIIVEDQHLLSLVVEMAEKVNLAVTERSYTVIERRCFDEVTRDHLSMWFKTMEWKVAFQCETLYSDRLISATELWDIHADITELSERRGESFTADVLKQLHTRLRRLEEQTEENQVNDVWQEFEQAIRDIGLNGGESTALNWRKRIFLCYHANMSPIGITLRGPFPDVSNRIIRQYVNYQDHFLRVSFTDEEGLPYQFDNRHVDGAGYLRVEVTPILKKGFTLGGRHFDFLLYSQSALKQQTVWFVSPFWKDGEKIDAEVIRGSIGSQWPPELLRCPARYAARLAQAFTATNSSVRMDPSEIEFIGDIERNGYCFSDGNGTLSRELADEIHRALSRQRRVRLTTPSVFQIRIQGSKGTISVDPYLGGRKMRIRNSMKKFEAVHHNEIEIARSFDKPIRFYLNRPLTMILSGLGVPNEVFLRLQREAVERTRDAVKTFEGAATFLELQGLGAAFALPSAITKLGNFGIPFDIQSDGSGFNDPFMNTCLQYAVHHVLREIKTKTRIPVPGCWKLVGIVDIFEELDENQIYAKVVETSESKGIYLEGPIMISKSPTIHPGDVQIVWAIGRPPLWSPLRHLENCVVFSQKGERPLPNKLSGSDLDGDEYDLVPLKDLHPPVTKAPGKYDPVPKKELDRDAGIEDIAEFVVDFITSDRLGFIATNFLLIADVYDIFNTHCGQLAELHSWAVDFPKNGNPVPVNRIPQPQSRVRPDWYAPEIITNNKADYYQSTSILGVLFRDVELPEVSDRARAPKRRRRGWRANTETEVDLEAERANISLSSMMPNDCISLMLRRMLDPLGISLVSDCETINSAISALFADFSSQLEQIAYAYSLARYSLKKLSEEELLIGTIIAKTTRHRERQERISAMREETASLVQYILGELEGGDDVTINHWINKAWTSWKVSLLPANENVFGVKCFGFIALRALFEGIKVLEEELDC